MKKNRTDKQILDALARRGGCSAFHLPGAGVWAVMNGASLSRGANRVIGKTLRAALNKFLDQPRKRLP